MFNIIFPQKTDQRYWHIHYEYVLNIFKALKCNITYEKRPDLIVTINGKDFLFDYWDTNEVRESNLPTFKFHCEQETDQVFAFPPVSFYNWDEYFYLEKKIQYSPLRNFNISCRQRPYAGALERRKHVQGILKEEFETKVFPDQYEEGQEPKILLEQIHQLKYWKEINDINIAVFVPGHHNNMLDRGHFQYLSFGCYTISPHLPEFLPFNKQLISGAHYTECKDDYSNMLDLILRKALSSNQNPYLEMGLRAKNLFKETSIPIKIGEWIESKL